MRCKVGDVVLVLRSACGNEGKVGTVRQWAVTGEQLAPDFSTGRSGWVVDGDFLARGVTHGMFKTFPFGVFPDADLKPLRDSEGTDEVLRYAGHPLSQPHREKVGA